MRISDWSSDVCSSDLYGAIGIDKGIMFASRGPCGLDAIGIFLAVTESERVFLDNRRGQDVAASFVKDMLETCLGADAPVLIEFGADRQDRKSVVKGQSGAVR